MEGIDNLLFLHGTAQNLLIVSGDGVLPFTRLIASGLASFKLEANNNNQLVTYSLSLTDKGKKLLDVWMSGRRTELKEALETDWGQYQ